MSHAGVCFALRSGSGGALAIIDVQSTDAASLDNLLASIGASGIQPGELKVRDIAGADHAIAARITPAWAQLMCHDGPAVRAAIRAALLNAGAREGAAADPCAIFPEASTAFEACLIDALARAASPLALDLLLAQPALWSRHPDFDPKTADAQTRAHILNRLIVPPLIVAVGAPNVGKSTLLNALAGRFVALASPEAGTTRDHVGAMLDLGGLVVRWVDTPGLHQSSSPIEAQAIALAHGVIASADLILHCGDAQHGWTDVPPVSAPIIRVATRCDLAVPDGGGLHSAAGTDPPEGLEKLVAAVCEALIPRSSREMQAPWAFHESLPRPEKRKPEQL